MALVCLHSWLSLWSIIEEVSQISKAPCNLRSFSSPRHCKDPNSLGRKSWTSRPKHGQTKCKQSANNVNVNEQCKLETTAYRPTGSMAPPGRKCSSHTFLTFSILLVESKKRSQVLFCKLLQGIEVSTTLIVLQETHNLQPFSRFLAMNDTKPENHSRSTGVWRAKAYQAKSFRKGNGVYYCILKKKFAVVQGKVNYNQTFTMFQSFTVSQSL